MWCIKCEHGGNRDIGQAKCVAIMHSKVQAIHGIKNLLFHLFTDGGGKEELSNGCLKDVHGFVDLKLGGIGRGSGIVARVCRELKGSTSNDQVFGSRHDKSRVEGMA